ncbi:NAD(P)/FAD-dependent oxidoreductase [Streptomyces malaysiensis]|uniref:NAD(P)/FAD-dependent oxidoreductase n=1 Tax=Streptomyces malaysiensis TaxID=92644 RepID=UPI003FA76575
MVIVGGGLAGTRLAQQLAGRVMGPGSGSGPGSGTGAGSGAGSGAVEVTIIGEEQHPAYNRVLLAEVLAGRYAPEVIALPTPAAGVRRLGGVRVVRVDRPTAEVLCDDGRRVPYDALVLATGSNPVLPPLRGLFEPDGHDLPDGVHAFRTMDDCLALGAAVHPGARAVVIGGGLLGVSAARALAQRGAQVVLAHQGEHLMERQLDPDASRLLRRHMAALGVETHTECRVRGLRTHSADAGYGGDGGDGRGSDGSRDDRGRGDGGGRAARAVSAVELADGYALEADLVVLACGVRPRVGLARAAGLEVARGIVIDDELRTSDPRVFAIGDCAEHAGVVYGLAGAAQEQADVLARVLSPTPPLPETGGLRPPAPHRGSAPNPTRGSAPTPRRGSAPNPRPGSAREADQSSAADARHPATEPRPGSAADANRDSAPSPRVIPAHDALRDPTPDPRRGTAPNPCQDSTPGTHQGSAQEPLPGSAPTPCRGSVPGPHPGSAHDAPRDPGPHRGTASESCQGSALASHQGVIPEPQATAPASHRGSALGPQDGRGAEPRQGSVPGAADADRFVGNRSAGRNGWAQTGHRAAPGDESSTRHTDPAPGNETSARYTGTRALTRLTLTAVPGSPTLAVTTAAAEAHSAPGPLDLAAFGNPIPAPGDDVIHLTDATRNTYRKVVVRGDRLLGGILLGDLGTVGALARTWEGDEPLPATPLLHLLTNDGGS